MAEDSKEFTEFDEFDDNAEFVDDLGQVPNEQEQIQPKQPVQMPQRQRGRPPQRRLMTPQMAAAQAAPLPVNQNPQQQTAQQTQTAMAQAPTVPPARFIPYEMPKRIGLLDRVTGKPVIEDEDMLRVVMAQLADIKNDLEEIKSYYS